MSFDYHKDGDYPDRENVVGLFFPRGLYNLFNMAVAQEEPSFCGQDALVKFMTGYIRDYLRRADKRMECDREDMKATIARAQERKEEDAPLPEVQNEEEDN